MLLNLNDVQQCLWVLPCCRCKLCPLAAGRQEGLKQKGVPQTWASLLRKAPHLWWELTASSAESLLASTMHPSGTHQNLHYTIQLGLILCVTTTQYSCLLRCQGCIQCVATTQKIWLLNSSGRQVCTEMPYRAVTAHVQFGLPFCLSCDKVTLSANMCSAIAS